MADDPRPGAEPSHAPGERLESWKEIAAYLRRDVRTVQRWEQTDGLPVHRLKRARRPIPYAYKAELDAWWTSRSETGPPPASQEALSAAPPTYRRHLAAGTAALLVMVAAVGAYRIVRPPQSDGSRADERAGAGPAANNNASALPAANAVPQKSIAVLPFLDLTEGMKEEEFADGSRAVAGSAESLETGSMGWLPRPILETLWNLKQQPPAAIEAQRRSIPMAFASDAGVFAHGQNAGEFVEYVRAGLTPEEAIATATTNAAAALGLEHESGAIRVGYRADLIGIAGDPLKDARALRNVALVITAGRVAKRPQ